MKQEYEAPKMDVIALEADDVIMSSLGGLTPFGDPVPDGFETPIK